MAILCDCWNLIDLCYNTFEEYRQEIGLNLFIRLMMFLLIHNPLSNNKKSKKNTAKYVKFFQKNGIEFMLRSSLKIENLVRFVENNPLITDILYLGGDGTLNYLVNSIDMDELKANLYFAQSGSGNDFLRSLKPIHSGNITIGEAATDVKTVSFINGCGMGIDGQVGAFVNQDKKKNKMSYFVNTFRALKVFRPQTLRVIVDGVEHEFSNAWFVAIQNGKYFGGGMKVAPGANPCSDQFEIVVAHTLKKWQVFLLFLSIYMGYHAKLTKFITIFHGKTCSFSCDTPQFFQADGEVLEGVRSINISQFKKHQIHAFEKRHFLKKK